MEQFEIPLTKAVLQNWGEEVLQSMRNVLIGAGKNASGELVSSLKFTVDFANEELDIEFEMAPYGRYVDSGRAPGKQPPIDSIKPWLRIKGIPETAAFPIAKAIGKRGIAATPFFESTVDSMKAKLISQLTAAYAKDVTNYIMKTLQ